MARNNILYIAPSVGIGGVETFLKHISQGHSSNCTPYFLLFQKGPLGQWLENQDAIVFYCHDRPRLSRPWAWILFLLELYRIVKHNKINIVHANLSYSALFAWPCYFFCKFIWFQHGPVSGWMDRLSYALPHHAVLFNSEHTLQQQLVVSGKSKARTTDFVLHLGTPAIDTDQRHFFKDQLLTKYQLPTDTMVVTMACRLQRWKGAHIAIQAVEKLLKTTDRPVVLFIHGDASWDNAYAEELKSMASELPVHICPPIEDLTSIYLATDIVLNCSTTPEPFGFTIIEALAASAIPIAARLGGPKEILSPYLEDCLFESENPDDLCRILLLFINDAKKMQIYKAKCFDLFENKFRLDTMIGNIESIYQKTLNP